MSEFDDDLELEGELDAEEQKAARALARALEGGNAADRQNAAIEGISARGDDSEPLPGELAALLRSVDSFEIRPEALSRGRSEMLGALDEQVGKHGAWDGSSARATGRASGGAILNPLRWLAWLPLPVAVAAGVFFVLRQPTQDTAAEMVGAAAVKSEQASDLPAVTMPSDQLLALQAQALTARLAAVAPDESGADLAKGAKERVVRPDDYEREMSAYRGQLLAVVDRRGR